MLVALFGLNQAMATPHCGMPLVATDLPAVRTGHVSAVGGEKALRDSYGTPNQALSTNFAVRWGTQGGVTPAEVQGLLDALEVAWSVQIEDLGHQAPYGTDAFRFNVYIGDTGDGAPPGYGTGGYYWVDLEGWPMNVVSRASLYDDNTAVHVASHEFYHALQGATARFAYDGLSAWFTEATAEWAALRTVPDNPNVAPFLWAYGGLPENALAFFDYPDTGQVQEFYQYGAFVFPLFVTNVVGDDVIRATWDDPGTEPDPLEVLRQEVSKTGHTLDSLFLDHAAANAVWDYEPWSDLFADQVEIFGGYFGLEPALATYSFDGTGGVRKSRARAPSRYGYNLIQLRTPNEGTLQVTVTGEQAGSMGSAARFGARVVQSYADGSHQYHEVAFDGVNGSLTLEGVGDEDTIWLAVGAWTDTALTDRWATERFEFDYDMAIELPEPEPIDTGEPTDSEPIVDPDGTQPPLACGCGSAQGPAWMWMVLPMFLLHRRR